MSLIPHPTPIFFKNAVGGSPQVKTQA